MTCEQCGLNLVLCTCPDADQKLEELRKSPYLYVENIIQERAKRKKSSESIPQTEG